MVTEIFCYLIDYFLFGQADILNLKITDENKLLFSSCKYSYAPLSGCPDNETPNSLLRRFRQFRYPDIWPKFWYAAEIVIQKSIQITKPVS